MLGEDYMNAKSRSQLLKYLEQEQDDEIGISACYAIAEVINLGWKKAFIYKYCQKIRAAAFGSDRIARRVNLIISILLIDDTERYQVKSNRAKCSSSPLGNDQLLDFLEATYDSYYGIDEAFQIIHPFTSEELGNMREVLAEYYPSNQLPNTKVFDWKDLYGIPEFLKTNRLPIGE